MRKCPDEKGGRESSAACRRHGEPAQGGGPTRPRGQPGQFGPEQSGKDLEQLSRESDRELKMEREEAGPGHARPNEQDPAACPVPTAAQTPSPALSSLGSGGRARVIGEDPGEGQGGEGMGHF